jgi:calcium/calmodulin-dependent protein kinase I
VSSKSSPTVYILTTRQILQGVEYLHSKEIVHRDLKPENILFKTKDPRSQIIIADFGIAAKLDHEVDDEGNVGKGFIGQSDLPKQWESELECANFMGTLGFTAPEVLLGFTQTEKIDIWSIGYVFT